MARVELEGPEGAGDQGGDRGFVGTCGACYDALLQVYALVWLVCMIYESARIYRHLKDCRLSLFRIVYLVGI
jgi:hypothetical protein